jgi:hypothetical protein
MSMYRENCDRCHQPTNGVTTMSMYNEDVICMGCKDAEKKRSDYKQAVDADVAEIEKGNYNYEGIGYEEKDIDYWRKNAEEDYLTTPISVLRYIYELEKMLKLEINNE